MDARPQDGVCEVVLHVMTRVPRYVRSFLAWSGLGPVDRLELDRSVLERLRPEDRRTYGLLREALACWDALQDSEGAPGLDARHKWPREAEHDVTRTFDVFCAALNDLASLRAAGDGDAAPARPARPLARSKSLGGLCCGARTSPTHHSD